MKKEVKIALIVIVVLIVLILSFTVKSKNNYENLELSNNPEEIIANAQNESETVKDDEKKEFIEINVDKYLEYYNGTEERIILLARKTCSYCQIAEPIIQNVAYENEIDIYYLNPDNFIDDDQTKFVSSDEAFKEGYGTPFLFIVKDGSIIDAVDGLTDKAHYIIFFKEHGFIS